MSGRFGVTLVPHGISGHELNLTSQRQNQAVLDEVVRLAESNSYSRKASKLVRSRVGDAKASCQIFGDCALVTLSLSPRDMEDIPIETGNTIRECAKEYFRSVAVVDAHNSISEPTVIPKEELDGLIEAGKIAIADAARQPRREFEVGASSSVLERFSLAEGIGPGGISAFVVKVQDQLVAYLTIDGNNMISGLRETVLKAMSDLGIEEGEIMTTDTHMVNGVVPARLGYHPIGEAVDISVLIENLDRIVKDAKSRLSPVEVSCTSGEVGVKTLGLKTFRNITAFMYNAVRIVVYSVPPLILLPTLIFLILLV